MDGVLAAPLAGCRADGAEPEPQARQHLVAGRPGWPLLLPDLSPLVVEPRAWRALEQDGCSAPLASGRADGAEPEPEAEQPMSERLRNLHLPPLSEQIAQLSTLQVLELWQAGTAWRKVLVQRVVALGKSELLYLTSKCSSDDIKLFHGYVGITDERVNVLVRRSSCVGLCRHIFNPYPDAEGWTVESGRTVLAKKLKPEINAVALAAWTEEDFDKLKCLLWDWMGEAAHQALRDTLGDAPGGACVIKAVPELGDASAVLKAVTASGDGYRPFDDDDWLVVSAAELDAFCLLTQQGGGIWRAPSGPAKRPSPVFRRIGGRRWGPNGSKARAGTAPDSGAGGSGATAGPKPAAAPHVPALKKPQKSRAKVRQSAGAAEDATDLTEGAATSAAVSTVAAVAAASDVHHHGARGCAAGMLTMLPAPAHAQSVLRPAASLAPAALGVGAASADLGMLSAGSSWGSAHDAPVHLQVWRPEGGRAACLLDLNVAPGGPTRPPRLAALDVQHFSRPQHSGVAPGSERAPEVSLGAAVRAAAQPPASLQLAPPTSLSRAPSPRRSPRRSPARPAVVQAPRALPASHALLAALLAGPTAAGEAAALQAPAPGPARPAPTRAAAPAAATPRPPASAAPIGTPGTRSPTKRLAATAGLAARSAAEAADAAAGLAIEAAARDSRVGARSPARMPAALSLAFEGAGPSAPVGSSLVDIYSAGAPHPVEVAAQQAQLPPSSLTATKVLGLWSENTTRWRSSLAQGMVALGNKELKFVKDREDAEVHRAYVGSTDGRTHYLVRRSSCIGQCRYIFNPYSDVQTWEVDKAKDELVAKVNENSKARPGNSAPLNKRDLAGWTEYEFEELKKLLWDWMAESLYSNLHKWANGVVKHRSDAPPMMAEVITAGGGRRPFDGDDWLSVGEAKMEAFVADTREGTVDWIVTPYPVKRPSPAAKPFHGRIHGPHGSEQRKLLSGKPLAAKRGGAAGGKSTGPVGIDGGRRSMPPPPQQRLGVPHGASPKKVLKTPAATAAAVAPTEGADLLDMVAGPSRQGVTANSASPERPPQALAFKNPVGELSEASTDADASSADSSDAQRSGVAAAGAVGHSSCSVESSPAPESAAAGAAKCAPRPPADASATDPPPVNSPATAVPPAAADQHAEQLRMKSLAQTPAHMFEQWRTCQTRWKALLARKLEAQCMIEADHVGTEEAACVRAHAAYFDCGGDRLCMVRRSSCVTLGRLIFTAYRDSPDWTAEQGKDALELILESMDDHALDGWTHTDFQELRDLAAEWMGHSLFKTLQQAVFGGIHVPSPTDRANAPLFLKQLATAEGVAAPSAIDAWLIIPAASLAALVRTTKDCTVVWSEAPHLERQPSEHAPALVRTERHSASEQQCRLRTTTPMAASCAAFTPQEETLTSCPAALATSPRVASDKACSRRADRGGAAADSAVAAAALEAPRGAVLQGLSGQAAATGGACCAGSAPVESAATGVAASSPAAGGPADALEQPGAMQGSLANRHRPHSVPSGFGCQQAGHDGHDGRRDGPDDRAHSGRDGHVEGERVLEQRQEGTGLESILLHLAEWALGQQQRDSGHNSSASPRPSGLALKDRAAATEPSPHCLLQGLGGCSKSLHAAALGACRNAVRNMLRMASQPSADQSPDENAMPAVTSPPLVVAALPAFEVEAPGPAWVATTSLPSELTTLPPAVSSLPSAAPPPPRPRGQQPSAVTHGVWGHAVSETAPPRGPPTPSTLTPLPLRAPALPQSKQLTPLASGAAAAAEVTRRGGTAVRMAAAAEVGGGGAAVADVCGVSHVPLRTMSTCAADGSASTERDDGCAPAETDGGCAPANRDDSEHAAAQQGVQGHGARAAGAPLALSERLSKRRRQHSTHNQDTGMEASVTPAIKTEAASEECQDMQVQACRDGLTPDAVLILLRTCCGTDDSVVEAATVQALTEVQRLVKRGDVYDQEATGFVGSETDWLGFLVRRAACAGLCNHFFNPCGDLESWTPDLSTSVLLSMLPATETEGGDTLRGWAAPQFAELKDALWAWKGEEVYKALEHKAQRSVLRSQLLLPRASSMASGPSAGACPFDAAGWLWGSGRWLHPFSQAGTAREQEGPAGAKRQRREVPEQGPSGACRAPQAELDAAPGQVVLPTAATDAHGLQSLNILPVPNQVAGAVLPASALAAPKVHGAATPATAAVALGRTPTRPATLKPLGDAAAGPRAAGGGESSTARAARLSRQGPVTGSCTVQPRQGGAAPRPSGTAACPITVDDDDEDPVGEPDWTDLS